MKLSQKVGSVPKQLSLFSPEELADCYLQSVVIRKVRQSLRKEKQANLGDMFLKKFSTNNVVKFPKKFVS